MAVIDKSVTNNYYCGESEIVSAIDRLTEAVIDLKPTEETDPRFAEALQREKDLIKIIQGISEP